MGKSARVKVNTAGQVIVEEILESTPFPWVFVYNSNPILISAHTASTPVQVPSYNSDFSDTDPTVLSLSGSNIPRIHQPGFYVVKAFFNFGTGGASTGLAYQVLIQLIYDIGSAPGTPHEWRWSHHTPSGAGEGAGYGATYHRMKSGTYPYADLDVIGADAGGGLTEFLMISQIPTGLSVPVNIMHVQAENQAGDTNVSDAYYFQLYVARLGSVRSASGGDGYI